MKEYNFKCNWDWFKPCNNEDDELYRINHLEYACNGNHIIKNDFTLDVNLIYNLIFKHKQTVNVDSILRIIDEFNSYLDNKIHEYENKKFIINHFHSIDIEAELIDDFLTLKYGEVKC